MQFPNRSNEQVIKKTQVSRSRGQEFLKQAEICCVECVFLQIKGWRHEPPPFEKARTPEDSGATTGLWKSKQQGK